MKFEEFEELEKYFDDKYRDYIQGQNNCTLCGTPLELSHKINTVLSTIKEEANCPHCLVKTRVRTFDIH